LAVTITGVVIMPASGFWLVLVPLAGMFFGRDRQQVVPSLTGVASSEVLSARRSPPLHRRSVLHSARVGQVAESVACWPWRWRRRARRAPPSKAAAPRRGHHDRVNARHTDCPCFCAQAVALDLPCCSGLCRDRVPSDPVRGLLNEAPPR
jgi:hypothetical protein